MITKTSTLVKCYECDKEDYLWYISVYNDTPLCSTCNEWAFSHSTKSWHEKFKVKMLRKKYYLRRRFKRNIKEAT